MGESEPQLALSWQQKTELYNDGFTILRGAVSPELVARARALYAAGAMRGLTSSGPGYYR